MPSYNPFNAISNRDARRINEFLIMRNFLSHYSDYAKRSYKRFMKSKYSYSRIPEPGDFLIAFSKSREYRWSVYLRTFLRASDDMMKSVL